MQWREMQRLDMWRESLAAPICVFYVEVSFDGGQHWAMVMKPAVETVPTPQDSSDSDNSEDVATSLAKLGAPVLGTPTNSSAVAGTPLARSDVELTHEQMVSEAAAVIGATSSGS